MPAKISQAQADLNKAQRAAVEYMDGPLLIVAGAGTGKTTVIANKIAYLIEQKLARPEEILALTFTDKAAEEMRERVDKQIKSDYSEMHISTFHTFCQRVLERQAIDIGLPNQFKLLTETAAWILVHKNLSRFNLNYYRPLGNPARHIHELLRHFSKCKDELISPEEYLEHAELTKLNTDDVPGGERDRLTEIGNAYHAYNQLLRDGAFCDFGDLIYYVNQLFATRPRRRAEYQERFKYILVDEFQDVNWAQYHLVQLLQRNNITVVGDDDQSIYAFRGASISNILRFKDDFPKAKEIVLTENYRSGQTILDLAYRSIQNNNPDRLEVKLQIDKHLKSKVKNLKSEVIHLHCPSLEDEAAAVASAISRLKAEDKQAAWDDFAILVRANNHADPFIAALEAAQLPYEFLSASGLYRQPIILDALNFFKLLYNPGESGAAFRLLCLPWWAVPEADLQRFTGFAKKKAITFYEGLSRGREIGLSTLGLATADKLLALIQAGARQARFEKPSAVLQEFLENSGYLRYLLREETRGNRAVIRQIYHLKQFSDYIIQYEAVTPGARVADFLEHWLLVLESGDRGALAEPADTPDSINILTVHKAKGLEFKYVFVVNLVEERFPTRSHGEGIEIPVALIKEQLPEGDSHYQEERRLFYVAVTRAKAKLYFTSAGNYGGTPASTTVRSGRRTKKLSRFLAEVGYEATQPPGSSGAKHTLPRQPRDTAQSSAKPGAFVYELPQSYSFSQLRSYATCPYQYKLAHILHIPTRGRGEFSFGQTIHATLQKFYLQVKELNRVEQGNLFAQPKPFNLEGAVRVPPLPTLLKLYDQCWIEDWYHSRDERERYYKEGKNILKIFYASQAGNWNIPLYLESFFKIKIGDYFISGRIDRVDKQSDGSLEIIDYKTGKGKEKLTAEDKEQLLIYQIALSETPQYQKDGSVEKLTFYYLNDNLRASFAGTSAELADLKAKITTTLAKIQQRDWAATPSQFVCGRCDFRDICEYRV